MQQSSKEEETKNEKAYWLYIVIEVKEHTFKFEYHFSELKVSLKLRTSTLQINKFTYAKADFHMSQV